MPAIQNGEDRPIPTDTATLSKQWRYLRRRAAAGHYYLGVAAVASSSIAAVVGGVDNGQIWLNTANVIDRIIRDFTSEVLGMVGRADFMAQLDFRCRAMNGLFLGITPSEKYQRGRGTRPSNWASTCSRRCASTARLGLRCATPSCST
jgi:hypothetical protein